MKEIEVIQTLHGVGPGNYEVDIEVDEEVETFYYSDSNAIFPLYNSLINAIRDFEDATINLTTCNPKFAREIQGNPNKNARMLEILTDLKIRNGLTINIIE